jgi:hypothetical protein
MWPGSALAGTEAGCTGGEVFASQKPEAKKWQGGHFLAAPDINPVFGL